MSVSKMDIFGKLIEGYVKVPPSFEEQAITALAVQLCQNVELKNIIYEPEPLNKYSSWFEWQKIIEERTTNMCQKLPLPPALKNKLISRIRPIVSHLDDWKRKQATFEISPLFVNSCLKPSDWTVVEMRLDEKKIAKRLVQDARIPVFQRYRMACFHCIEDIIPSLWSQISSERRSGLLLHNEFASVKLWHLHLDGDFNELVPRNKEFWFALLRAGVWDGSILCVLQCWGKLGINVRDEVLQVIATETMSHVNFGFRGTEADIICFLLTQMSKDQRGELFQEMFQLQNSKINIFAFFLQWPYLDLIVPLTKELWNILPEVKYKKILEALAYTYSNVHYDVGLNDYMEYEYGYLLIELLEETPDRFKRYVFGNNYPSADERILYTMLNDGHLKLHYKKVFKHIWKHVTLEEKRLFLRSPYGVRFCSNLTKEDNWNLLDSILRECLPEDEIHIFKKKF